MWNQRLGRGLDANSLPTISSEKFMPTLCLGKETVMVCSLVKTSEIEEKAVALFVTQHILKSKCFTVNPR
jgi:hypothetical protein